MSEIVIPTLAEVDAVFEGIITAPDKRSQQVEIGASEVGGCPFCVGYTLARKFFELPKRGSFGYAAWLGTMSHYWLERKIPQRWPVEALPEHKVLVGELDGYGPVYGTADFVIPSWRRLVDYKFPGEYSVKLMQSKRVAGETAWASTQYRYQQQLLAHGLRLIGIEIDMCQIKFFPRHTNSYKSVLSFEEPYNEGMVTLAFQRLEAILEDVLAGRLDEIESDPDCYSCSRRRPYIVGYQNTPRTENTDQEQGALK